MDSQGQDSRIPVFPVFSLPDVIHGLGNAVSQPKDLEWLSFPLPFADIVVYEPVRLFLHPLYLVFFDIDEDFETSVGLIRSLHARNEFIAFDGSSGYLVDNRWVDIQNLDQATTVVDWTNLPIPVSKDKYGLVPAEVGRVSMALIRDTCTKTVTYMGANNVGYNKTCRPKASSVQIHRTEQVFLPIWSFRIDVVEQSYDIRLVKKGGSIYVIDTGLEDCRICNETINDETRLICNSCGNLTHPPSFWKRCGFRCRRCAKTVCKTCTCLVKEWLVFNKTLCKDCAELVGS